MWNFSLNYNHDWNFAAFFGYFFDAEWLVFSMVLLSAIMVF